MFVRQRRTKSPAASELQIKSYMTNTGYHFNDSKKDWITVIGNINVIVNDLNSFNCSINKNELEIFDPMIRIDYE